VLQARLDHWRYSHLRGTAVLSEKDLDSVIADLDALEVRVLMIFSEKY
jgi:hypothetical protein